MGMGIGTRKWDMYPPGGYTLALFHDKSLGPKPPGQGAFTLMVDDSKHGIGSYFNLPRKDLEKLHEAIGEMLAYGNRP